MCAKCNSVNTDYSDRQYYKVCPFCGAHLDPGERCDCQEGQGKQ